MLSIVFGTCNRIEKLKKSMDSIAVASQRISEKPEIIIIDGGSTDGTIQYLKTIPGVILIEEGGLHGVTRAYNRGFRIASRPYVTWFSDDFTYDADALLALTNRLPKEARNTLLALSISIGDGAGYRNYAPNTPVGAGHKDLFKLVNYWSEDFITYASDNDFSMKIRMSGGKVIGEPKAKVIHHINANDDLHRENLKGIKCQKRYKKLYSKGTRRWAKTYPDIWINASGIDDLIYKLENARFRFGWCNFFTGVDFGHRELLNSMNVRTTSFRGRREYAVVV